MNPETMVRAIEPGFANERKACVGDVRQMSKKNESKAKANRQESGSKVKTKRQQNENKTKAQRKQHESKAKATRKQSESNANDPHITPNERCLLLAFRS